MSDIGVLCEGHKSCKWIRRPADRRGVVPGVPTGSKFQGGSRSAASSVGRNESDSRRGVRLRGDGSGVVSEMMCTEAEPLGKGVGQK